MLEICSFVFKTFNFIKSKLTARLTYNHFEFNKASEKFDKSCTPPRTPRISGLKSQFLKPIFFS